MRRSLTFECSWMRFLERAISWLQSFGETALDLSNRDTFQRVTTTFCLLPKAKNNLRVTCFREHLNKRLTTRILTTTHEALGVQVEWTLGITTAKVVTRSLVRVVV